MTYEQKVEAIKKKVPGFSHEQAEATVLAVDAFTGFLYSAIRAGKHRDARDMAQTIEEYLEYAPKYRGTIYRGISVSEKHAREIIDYYKSGYYGEMQGISSWTANLNVAREFADYGAIGIIFQIRESRHGVSIRDISRDGRYEDEVLESSGVWYKLGGSIEEIIIDGKTYTMIPLKEI